MAGVRTGIRDVKIQVSHHNTGTTTSIKPISMQTGLQGRPGSQILFVNHAVVIDDQSSQMTRFNTDKSWERLTIE